MEEAVQFSHSAVSDPATPWTAARRASLSITSSQSLLKFVFTESVTPSRSLSSHSPAFKFSQHQGLFQRVVLYIRWLKYWRFSFSISLSNEYSELIAFTINWLDFLVVQGTLKYLLQHYSSKASILWRSTFLWSNSRIHT